MTTLASRKHIFIGDGAFYHRVIAILAPIIIQNTVTNIINLVDNVMVGRVGTLPISAVAIVNQLMFVFFLCIFGGLSGVGIFTSQFVGIGDKEGVCHTFRLKWFVALFLLAVCLIVFLVFPKQLIGLYLSETTSPEDAAATLQYGTSYLTAILFGLLPFVVSQIYGSTLRELGQTKLPMLASVVGILVNVFFNYLLIFGNEGLSFLPFAPMGVVCAGIATSLSRYVEMAILLISVHKHRDRYPFLEGVYHRLSVPFSLCKKVFQKGFPLLLNEFLWSFGMAALMQCYSSRGITVVAATNISSTVGNIFNVIYISMGTAIAIMVGHALGANNHKEAKNIVWRLLALSVVACLATGVLLFAASFFIPLAYNTTNEVRHLATQLLWVVAALMPFNAVCHGCYFAMRSGGRTIITFLFDSGFIWLVSYPLAFCLARFSALPIVLFFLLVQGIEAVKAIAAVLFIKSGFWLNNIVQE